MNHFHKEEVTAKKNINSLQHNESIKNKMRNGRPTPNTQSSVENYNKSSSSYNIV
jgi:hypothetical protein